MRFSQDDDDRMIADTLERVMRDADGTNPRATLAELGLWTAWLPEQHGGLDGGARSIAAVAQALGRHRKACDYLPSAVLAGEILAASSHPAARKALDSLGGGEVGIVPALLEPGRRYRWYDPVATAKPGAIGHELHGEKVNVACAGGADAFLVPARIDGRVALFLVAADATGLTVNAYAAFGGSALGRLVLDGAAATLIVGPDDTAALLDRVAGLAAFTAAAEILGACDGAFAQAMGYLPIREQFGRKLSKFQALQHRAADLHGSIEMLRSLVLGAANSLELGWNAMALADCAAAASLAFEVGDLVCREAIHLHGAIGMTRDLGVGGYLMRVNELARLFGDAPEQKRRLLALTLDVSA